MYTFLKSKNKRVILISGDVVPLVLLSLAMLWDIATASQCTQNAINIGKAAPWGQLKTTATAACHCKLNKEVSGRRC